ncbi:MAG: phenylalanine--tRNA ligase subunit beta [Candidatus Omnitrophota bacterium]|jgi:phenylalanyl-tRNA synthetase beta chain
MLISYNWLKEYVGVEQPVEELAELFTMSGLSVASITDFLSDRIIEIEVTSNRPDWLSVIGVARELSAITGEKLKVPAVKDDPARGQGSIAIEIHDKKLCPRYTARIIRNVKIGESPDWLKMRIESVGLRPVNNIVDVTNFCLFETGEPMHAFDLDKISGGKIIVRKAKKGEKIVTIDGIERTLDDTVLVIADAEKPVAVAGIMGGLNTEVNYSTKNILLEAASFDGVSIRRAARKLGISTDSSYRFERKIDEENIPYSSARAADIICGLAGGEREAMTDIRAGAASKKTINLKYSHLDKVLGLQVPRAEVKRTLGSLGLGAVESADGLSLSIPSFRSDLENEIDLVEEVSRIYGYGKIPSTIPAIAEQPTRRESTMAVEDHIRRSLTAAGAYEIMTYSLLSRRAFEDGNIEPGSIAQIRNPLSAEQEVMRPSLVAGMLGAMAWNMNRKTKDLKLFELGNVYIKEEGDKFAERKTLAIGMTGVDRQSWADGTKACDFYVLKGALENLLGSLGIDSFSMIPSEDKRYSPASRAQIEIGGETVGVIGEVGRSTASAFDIKEKVFVCEVCVDRIAKHSNLEKHFRELPKYPSVSRDISVIAGKDIKNNDIILTAKKAAGPLLKEIALIDRYAGKQIPEGKASLTYRLEYQDPKKTLEDKEVSDVHGKVLSALEKNLGLKQR